MDIAGVIITFDGVSHKRTERIVYCNQTNTHLIKHKNLFQQITNPLNPDYGVLMRLGMAYLSGSKRYVINGADERGIKQRKVWEPMFSLINMEKEREESLVNMGIYNRPKIN